MIQQHIIHKCPACTKNYKSKSALNVHYKNKHNPKPAAKPPPPPQSPPKTPIEFLNSITDEDSLIYDHFIDAIQITEQDLETIIMPMGYVAGITHLIAREFAKIPPLTRPVHCVDKENLTMFFRFEYGRWICDEENNENLIDIAMDFSQKCACKISELRCSIPPTATPEERQALTDKYDHMFRNAFGGADRIRLIKQICLNIINIVYLDWKSCVKTI